MKSLTDTLTRDSQAAYSIRDQQMYIRTCDIIDGNDLIRSDWKSCLVIVFNLAEYVRYIIESNWRDDESK